MERFSFFRGTLKKIHLILKTIPKGHGFKTASESAEFIPEEEAEHKPRPFSRIEDYLNKFIYIRNLGDRFSIKLKEEFVLKLN